MQNIHIHRKIKIIHIQILCTIVTSHSNRFENHHNFNFKLILNSVLIFNFNCNFNFNFNSDF